MPTAPPRIELAPGLEISRIVTGLWQVADMERDGRTLDPEAAAAAMLDYAQAGFDSFDMADHYGSAEVIAGRFHARVAAGEARADAAGGLHQMVPGARPDDARDRPRRRRAQPRAAGRRDHRSPAVPLVDFEHPAYLDAMKELAALRREGLIRHLGVTNFDTDHLRVLVKHGTPSPPTRSASRCSTAARPAT